MWANPDASTRPHAGNTLQHVATRCNALQRVLSCPIVWRLAWTVQDAYDTRSRWPAHHTVRTLRTVCIMFHAYMNHAYLQACLHVCPHAFTHARMQTCMPCVIGMPCVRALATVHLQDVPEGHGRQGARRRPLAPVPLLVRAVPCRASAPRHPARVLNRRALYRRYIYNIMYYIYRERGSREQSREGEGGRERGKERGREGKREGEGEGEGEIVPRCPAGFSSS
jgi:hypothetical protein